MILLEELSEALVVSEVVANVVLEEDELSVVEVEVEPADAVEECVSLLTTSSTAL